VSGPVLLSLTDSDLADSLGVRHPLHRRKILLSVDELAEAEEQVVEADAASGGRWSMQGEVDKLALVVDLKKAFDKLDRNGDGELGVDELATAFGHMGLSADVAMEKVRPQTQRCVSRVSCCPSSPSTPHATCNSGCVHASVIGC
jgi:hypothetical protein